MSGLRLALASLALAVAAATACSNGPPVVAPILPASAAPPAGVPLSAPVASSMDATEPASDPEPATTVAQKGPAPAMCTDLGDQACVTHARQIQAHRQGSP